MTVERVEAWSPATCSKYRRDRAIPSPGTFYFGADNDGAGVRWLGGSGDFRNHGYRDCCERSRSCKSRDRCPESPAARLRWFEGAP